VATLRESIPTADRTALASSARAAAATLEALALGLEGDEAANVPLFVARSALQAASDRCLTIRAGLAKYL